MKKAVVFAVVLAVAGLFAGLSAVWAEGNVNLAIESVSLERVTSEGCDIRWHVVIKNNGAAATVNGGANLNTAQGVPNVHWSGTGGTMLGSIAPGATRPVTMIFTRQATAEQFRAQVSVQGNVVAESIADLPVDVAPSIELTDCTLSDENRYTVGIRNLGPNGVCNLVVQGSAALSSSPDAWAAAGGTTIPCLNGQATYQRTGYRPAGYNIIKVSVKRDNVLFAEKVFNFTTQQSTGSRTASPESAAGACKECASKAKKNRILNPLQKTGGK